MKKVLSVFVAVLLLSMSANAQSLMERNAVKAMRSHKMATSHVFPQMVTPIQHNAVKAAADTITEFPYTQGFENGLEGWTIIDADGDQDNWVVLTTEETGISAHSGGAMILSQSYSNNLAAALTPDNWLISPAIVVPESEEGFSLGWYVLGVDPDWSEEHYAVYVLTSPSADRSATPVFEETLENGWGEYLRRTVSLNDYVGQTIYVAFRHYNVTDQFAIAIDDIRFKIPGAPEIALNAPKAAYFGDTVSMNVIIEDGALPMTFEWTIPNADILSSNDAQDSIVVLWNESGWDTITVVATNIHGEASFRAPINIVNCSDVNTVYPYTHDFNTEYDCWHGEDWNTTDYAVSGLPVAVSFSFDDDDVNLNADNWLYSPKFEIPADSVYEFEWIALLGGGSQYPGDHYTVNVVTEDTTIVIFEETLVDAGELSRKVALSDYAGQEIRIAFHHFACQTGYALCLATPSIHFATLPEVSLKAPRSARNIDNVTLEASAISAFPVEYAWTIQGATPDSVGDTNVVVVSWTGAAEGDYVVSVTATSEIGSNTIMDTIHIFNCDNGLVTAMTTNFSAGLGCWSTFDADGDGFNWETVEESLYTIEGEEGYGAELSNTGDDALISWSNYPSYGLLFWQFGLGEELNANDYLVSPEIQVNAGQSTLSFYLMTLDPTNPDQFELRIKTGEAPTSAADFTTVLYPLAPVVGSESFTQYGVNLSAYEGQKIYLAFVHKSNNLTALVLDDIKIDNSTVGVDNIEMAEVAVYPNPTTGVVSVMAEDALQVDVLDLNGRVVKSQPKAGALDMTSLSDGIYFVRVITNNGTSMQKVIKK